MLKAVKNCLLPQVRKWQVVTWLNYSGKDGIIICVKLEWNTRVDSSFENSPKLSLTLLEMTQRELRPKVILQHSVIGQRYPLSVDIKLRPCLANPLRSLRLPLPSFIFRINIRGWLWVKDLAIAEFQPIKFQHFHFTWRCRHFHFRWTCSLLPLYFFLSATLNLVI